MSNKIWLSVCIQEILVVEKPSVRLSPNLYEFPYPILRPNRNVYVCSRRSDARKLAGNFFTFGAAATVVTLCNFVYLVPYILS